MKFKIAVIAAATVIAGAWTASATLVPVGDPVEIGSWMQNWAESGVGPFTQIEVRNPAGSSFKAPSLAAWYGQWPTIYTSPTLGIIKGSAVTSLNFATYFTSATTTPFSFDLYVWNGSTLVDSGKARWSGSSWSWGAADLAAGPAVPEPTTMIAATLLLLPFGASTLRVLRKSRKA